MGYSNDQRPLQQGVNLKHVVLMILLLGLLLFRPLVPSVVVDAVFLPTMIVSAWLAGGRTRSSLIVTVVSSLGAFGVLLFDLLAHEQFNTFFHQPLGFPVAVAILVLFVYCAVVILRSLLTTERVFVNEIIGTFNLYLIMGYIWSYVYLLLELTSPGSFESATKPGTLVFASSISALSLSPRSDLATPCLQAPLRRCWSSWKPSSASFTWRSWLHIWSACSLSMNWHQGTKTTETRCRSKREQSQAWSEWSDGPLIENRR